MKICYKCKKEKDLVDFHKNSSYCKDCVKIYNAERSKIKNKWYLKDKKKNPEKYKQAYKKRNKDPKVKEYKSN